MNSSGTAKVVFMNSRDAAKVEPSSSSGETELLFRPSNGAATIPSGPAFGGPKNLVYIYMQQYKF